MKTYRYRAFTLVEIMTVMVIIAILVGILVPALNQVKKLAKETRQKAQIGSIDIAVNLYKNDLGEYPPSHGWKPPPPADTNDYTYCGAQTLAEAMFGQDLLGFHPASIYRADGLDKNSTTDLYPYPLDPVADKANLDARKDAYLDRTNISVFTPRQIFGKSTLPDLTPDNYAICDVFTAVNRKITISGSTKTYKIGTPVLYFRANPSAVNMELMPSATPSFHAGNIYNFMDNCNLLGLGKIADGKPHDLAPGDAGNAFYGFIRDSMIPVSTVGSYGKPVRPDSFLLISAGSDGIYGTRDDICNFDPNLPG